MWCFFLTEAVDSYIFFTSLSSASSDGCSLERIPPSTKSILSSSKKERIKPNVVLMDKERFRKHLYWPDTNTNMVLLHFSHNNESNSIKSMINVPSIYLPFISTAGTEVLIDFPEHNTARESLVTGFRLTPLLVDLFLIGGNNSNTGKHYHLRLCESEVKNNVSSMEIKDQRATLLKLYS